MVEATEKRQKWEVSKKDENSEARKEDDHMHTLRYLKKKNSPSQFGSVDRMGALGLGSILVKGTYFNCRLDRRPWSGHIQEATN